MLLVKAAKTDGYSLPSLHLSLHIARREFVGVVWSRFGVYFLEWCVCEEAKMRKKNL